MITPRVRRAWRSIMLLCMVASFGTACGGARAASPPRETPDAVALVPERIVDRDDLTGQTFAEDLNVVLLAMTRHPAGLYYRDVEVGTGAVAITGREVAVTYIAYLPDGTEVDRTSTTPLTFEMGKGTVIRGWDIGVRGMKVGGTRQLVVPARLAYGRRAVGKVPANSAMVFLMRLDAVR